jgi:archaeosine synthase
MLDITDRSGPARAGRWLAGQSKVDFPNILFHDSAVFPAPPYAELTISGQQRLVVSLAGKEELASFEQMIVRPLDVGRDEALVEPGANVVVVRGTAAKSMSERTEELFVLGNAFELRRDAKAFVDAVVALRNAIGYDRLIYAPGIMEPSNLALQVYMGVDLFDSSLPLYQASRGKVLLTEGSLSAEDASWLVSGPEQVQVHNVEAAWRELKLVRHMISVGRLRELVETRVNANPWMVAALRIFDLQQYAFQEERTAVVGPQFYCNSKA